MEISELMITSTETMGTLAKNLAKIMADRGVNQVELAKKSGIKQQLISSYIKESRYAKFPSLKNLIALAKALKCSLDELTGFEGSRSTRKVIDKSPQLGETATKLARFYESLPVDDWRKRALEEFLLKSNKKK